MKKFYEDKQEIAIIPLLGTEEISEEIKKYLNEIYEQKESKIIPLNLIRFSTGDAKAVLRETVRGKDVFIVADVGNYNCRYMMYGKETFMSPDEHFQNLKRVISAIGGKANRITVIMPMLYSGRQDRRVSRESLDCAIALRELENMGVNNIMSFDVHDDRVQNAIPLIGFDNLIPIYQVIKTMKRVFPTVNLNEKSMIVVSPDVGGANRNLKYSNELQLEMGLFYKRRNFKELINGKYPVAIHKYIGPIVKGKDIFMCDDLIASGETMLDVIIKLKELGANKIFIAATFGLFTEGIDKFNKAYEEGLFEAIFITNATYRSDVLLNAPWYKEVNLSQYIAYYIYCINTGKSISNILDPHEKIQKLLGNNN